MNGDDIKEIKESLHELKKSVDKLPVLEERLSNWMSTTAEYRKNQSEKIAALTEIQGQTANFIQTLPCNLRIGVCEEKHKAVDNQIKIIWGAISGVALAIISLAIKTIYGNK